MLYGIVDVHFFFFFFSATFVRAISLEPLLVETPNWVCCLVLWSNFALLLTIQFASLLFFFFCHDFVRAISLEPLLAETPNWVCCLFLRSNFALLLTIQFASLFIYLFFFPPWFCHDFVLAISLEPLLAETPNWVCCLVLRSNCALLLTIQFASFFSATILSGPYLWNRYSQTLQIECAAWSCGLIVHWCLPSNLLLVVFFIFFVFSAKILSGPHFWNRYSQRLQIECAAWSCGLVVHCCLPSNSLCYFFILFFFFLPRFCPSHISGTVTRRESKLSVLLGPAV